MFAHGRYQRIDHGDINVIRNFFDKKHTAFRGALCVEYNIACFLMITMD